LTLPLSVLTVIADTGVVANPSFELNDGTAPTTWTADAWDKNAASTTFTYEVGGRTGDRSVAVENFSANDARWTQLVTVAPNTIYRLSVWTETYNIGDLGKGANISVASKFETSPDIKGTNPEWQLIEMYVKTGSDATEMLVTIGIGSYGSMNTGKAWFDDVNVETVDSVPEGAPVATIGTVIANNVNPNTGKTEPLASPPYALWIVLGLAVVTVFGGYAFYLIKFSAKKNTAPPEK
jgi:hypothetical protein